MKIGIGIISYFPDEEDVRTERAKRCNALIAKCNEVFDSVPIVVIAQNWRGEVQGKNLDIVSYDNPLCITNARKALREYMLSQEYDYMIFFDDDCVLEGTAEDGKRFLEMLKANPDKYIYSRINMFKLCAFSKAIYEANELPPLCVVEGTGIEDMAYARILRHKHPDAEIKGYDWGTLREVSRWWDDKYSTWDRQGVQELLKKTGEYLRGVIGGNNENDNVK